MWDRLKRIWKLYSDLSIPARLAIGGVVSAVGGAGVVGFLSEYAAYTYAIYYGVRPPLEGVPFLRVAVTAMTFLVYSCSALIFLLLLLLARLLLWYSYNLLRQFLQWSLFLRRYFESLGKLIPVSRKVAKLFVLPEPEELVDRYLRPQKPRVIAVWTIVAFLLVGTLVFTDQIGATGQIWISLLYGVVTGILVGTALVLLWRPALISAVASMGTLLFFVVAPFSLFHAPSYGSVLRMIGYGGGIPVSVGILAESGEIVRGATGFLVLRTNEALMLYEPPNGVIEIPYGKIGSIDYSMDDIKRPIHWNLPGSADGHRAAQLIQPIAGKKEE